MPYSKMYLTHADILAGGTLEVTPMAITITAASDTKVYDGTALTKNGYSVDAPAVDALIESLVRELRIEQGEQRDKTEVAA